jgi:hypothetical protein
MGVREEPSSAGESTERGLGVGQAKEVLLRDLH